MRRKRRTFSKEFKRESVALVADHGYSYAEAGRSLDIDAKLVGRWHRVATFKVSRDPRFIEKLEDIVGLYLNLSMRWCCVVTRKARFRHWIARNRDCP